MELIDVIILLLAVFIIAFNVVNYIIRKKNMATGECSYCSLKTEKMLKQIRKELKKDKKIREF